MTTDIAKGLYIREGTSYACIAHLDKKASEHEEGKQFTYRPVSSSPVKIGRNGFKRHATFAYLDLAPPYQPPQLNISKLDMRQAPTKPALPG